MKNKFHVVANCSGDSSRAITHGASFGDLMSLRNVGGFTLVELLVIIVILGILMVISVPTYSFMKLRAKNSACLGEIRTIDKEVVAYEVDLGVPPDNLTDIGRGVPIDPWGNAYQYQKLFGGVGTPYEDPIGDPLNTDYDLFSKGADGNSTQSLTVGNTSTDDDILRGRDGLYFGLGNDF